MDTQPACYSCCSQVSSLIATGHPQHPDTPFIPEAPTCNRVILCKVNVLT